MGGFFLETTAKGQVFFLFQTVCPTLQEEFLSRNISLIKLCCLLQLSLFLLQVFPLCVFTCEQYINFPMTKQNICFLIILDLPRGKSKEID